MANLTLVQAVQHALKTEMALDESVIVLGEDVGVNGGVFRATDGLYDQFGEDRVIDTPLAESGIIGTALGLAITGFKPVAEIQFMGFIYECMDAICSQSARLYMRSGGKFNVPMVIRTPYGGGVKTPEMHSDSLEALFLHTPGVKVVTPSSPYEAKGLLISAIRDPDPVLFMEPMKLYRSFREEVPEEAYTIPLGRARVVREGSDLTMIAYGPTVPTAEKTAEELEKRRGIRAEVIDLRTIAPLDMDTIIQSVEKTNRAVIIHEAVKSAGVGAEIAAQINERAILHLESPVLRVTGFDTPYPPNSIEDEWLPNIERTMWTAEKVLDF
ncbi:MAG: alpha-ketoacid dehydrogenase subunit beta [Bacillaceae bacterium]|nr:alpha-ketoacid dehydrogenase subunit beta [Bacillaceae bacterium]